jgi:protein-tyrosine phosphatase
MAEGVFRKAIKDAGLSDQVQIDSAGTADYHVNKPPDDRAIAAAMRRGVDIRALRGRQALAQDMARHDYVLAMDESNYDDLLEICPQGHEHKLKLFLEYATRSDERVVPDPYYGGPSGFDRVLDLIEDAAEGLLADIRTRLQP